MKKYICLGCGLVRYSRKKIREHVRDYHNIKGLNEQERKYFKSQGITSLISNTYLSVDSDKDIDRETIIEESRNRNIVLPEPSLENFEEGK